MGLSPRELTAEPIAASAESFSPAARKNTRSRSCPVVCLNRALRGSHRLHHVESTNVLESVEAMFGGVTDRSATARRRR